MRRIVGYFVLWVPLFVAPALVLGIWSRDGVIGILAISAALVPAAWVARTVARRNISVVAFRVLLVLSVLGWVGTGMCGVAIGVLMAVDKHLTYGSAYCWQPPDFSPVNSCRGRDHSLMQGRLSYSEALGQINASVCRALLAGAKNVTCHQTKENFAAMECPARYASGWRCFGCQRLAATGDRYRVSYFVRGDCFEAVGWYSANVETEAMEKALDGSPPTH